MESSSSDCLSVLEGSREISCELLTAAFEQWLVASTRRRNQFRDERMKLVLDPPQLGWGQSHQCITSGTTGRKKSYLWGPGIIEVINFYTALKFRGMRYDRVVKLLPFWGRTNMFFKQHNCASSSLIFDGRSTSPHEYLTRALEEPGRVILEVSPSLLKRVVTTDLDLLAELAAGDKMAGIYTTGEALEESLRKQVRSAGVDLRNAMRCYDGGATFVTCEYGNEHWVPFLSEIRIDDEKRLISTDLFNLAMQFIEYWNGDIVQSIDHGICQCQLVTSEIIFSPRQVPAAELDGKSFSHRDLTRAVSIAITRKLEKKDLGFRFIWDSECTRTRFGVGKGTLIALYELSNPDRFIIDHILVAEVMREILGLDITRVIVADGTGRIPEKDQKIFFLDVGEENELVDMLNPIAFNQI